MHKKHIKKRATTVAFLSFALSAVAAVRTLPTPPESTKSDTESSICQECSDWLGNGRDLSFWVAAFVTATNCIQVSAGNDRDGDGDLSPSETKFSCGFDLGVPFIREEVNVGKWRSSIREASDFDHTPLATTNADLRVAVFSFKQPSSVSNRVDFVKVTKRGRGESDAEIAAEIIRRGAALFIR